MRRTMAGLGFWMLLAVAAPASAMTTHPDGRVVIDTTHVLQTIRPDEALGAAVDGVNRGQVATQYTPRNIRAMLSAGLQPVSYRLRTELGVEAWHWNAQGTWSDPVHQQGYWTSSDKPGAPILMTHGYALPRRGDSNDQANDTGWSRLDDGDETTFWKSNPYLDKTFTHEAENHPQWAIADLGAPMPVDTIKVSWGEPYAVAYRLQYWVGGERDPAGTWVDFPGGAVSDGKGGMTTLHVPAPVTARFVRLKLEAGSNTAPAGSTDIRDRLGYAVRELYIGRIGPDGVFTDALKHAPDRTRQSWTVVSSTDPWHRAVDRDDDVEQPGIDRIYTDGMTRGLAMMVPVGAVYDTPDNAAALIRYIEARHYPIRGVELGEEPDGQFMSGIDYADLYIEAADAVHGVDPKLKLGGPSQQDGIAVAFMDDNADKSFTSQFVHRLKARGRLGDLDFFSFERYPFDELCVPPGRLLIQQSQDMAKVLARLDQAGVPKGADWTISEYGFSPFSGRYEDEVPSALLAADIVGQFLSHGGKAAFLYGYPPGTPDSPLVACSGYGDMMLHEADENGRAKWPMPTYWAARLMTRAWTQPGHGEHQIYGATVEGLGEAVTAYAVRRPDGKWALMMVNRDDRHAHAVAIAGPMTGKVDVWQYSPAQYAWSGSGPQAHPLRDRPPVRSSAKANGVFVLPALSLTVVRGK